MTIKIKGKTVLILAAGAGMLLTAWLAARNTPEAQKRKEEALEAKREATGNEDAELTILESAKAQIGAYIPAIISGTVTIGSLVGSEVINKDTLKKAEKAIGEFKTMTDQLDGKGSSKLIDKAIEQKRLDEKANTSWGVKELFRIRFQNQVIEFFATREEVIGAFYQANRYFQSRGQLAFNDLLQFLHQEKVDEGDDRGWEVYIGETVYGYTWIDFGLKGCEDEPWITDIFFAVYPHFLNEDDCEAEIEEGGCQKLTASVQEFDAAQNKPDYPVEVKIGKAPW